MKAFLSLLVVAALGVGGWLYWQKQNAAAASAATANARPTSAVVETRSIRFAVTAAGDIGPAEQVSVRPEVNGRINELPVDVGDHVRKGDLLFSLDDRDLQIEKESEEKAVERTRLELDQVQRDFRRANELFEAKLLSQELFEDARTKADLARNSIDRAQKSLDLINDRLRKTRVQAPFDCTVLTRPVSVGQAVSGSGGFNAGTEVLTIANLNDLVIAAHINQADVTRLHVNQEVEVTVEAIPGLKLVGKVERLAPQSTLKNNIRGFAARILLKDVEKAVRPGMTANVSIPVASAENVVAAPLASIFTETNPETRQIERYVYLKRGEEWERRAITLGVSDYFFAEVTRGLAAGDEISLEDRSKTAKSAPAGAPALARPPAPRTAATSGTPSTPSSRPAAAAGSPTRPAAASATSGGTR
jgi:HlyD family secretion protein